MEASDFLIESGGRLDATWFEPHNLEADLLPAWLSAATGSDEAIEASVYARGYDILVGLIMHTPSTEKADDITRTRSAEQLKYWQSQAAYWRGKADALNGVGGPSIVAWEGESIWRN